MILEPYEAEQLEEYIQRAFAAFKLRLPAYRNYDMKDVFNKEDTGARSYVRMLKSPVEEEPDLFIKIIPSRYVLRAGSRDEYTEFDNDDSKKSPAAPRVAWKELFTMFVLEQKSVEHPEINAYFTKAKAFFEYNDPQIEYPDGYEGKRIHEKGDKNDCIAFIVMSMEKCNCNTYFSKERDIITENDLRKMVTDVNNVLMLMHEPFDSKIMLDKFVKKYQTHLTSPMEKSLKEYFHYDKKDLKDRLCYFAHCDIKLNNVLVSHAGNYVLSDFSAHCVVGTHSTGTTFTTPEERMAYFITEKWIPEKDPRSYDMWMLGMMVRHLSEFRLGIEHWLSAPFQEIIEQLSPSDLLSADLPQKENLINRIPTSEQLAEKLAQLDKKADYDKPIPNSEAAIIRLLLLDDKYEEVIERTKDNLDDPHYFRLNCYARASYSIKNNLPGNEILSAMEKRLDESPLNKLLYYTIAYLFLRTEDSYIRNILQKMPNMIGELAISEMRDTTLVKYLCATEVLFLKNKIAGVSVENAIAYLNELMALPYPKAYAAMLRLIRCYIGHPFANTLDETGKEIYDILNNIPEEKVKKLMAECEEAEAMYSPKKERENYILTLMQ